MIQTSGREFEGYYEYLESGGDWRNGFIENCNPFINMITPLGESYGFEGVDYFLSNLIDILQDANIHVTGATRSKNHISLLWTAIGSTSEIDDGEITLIIKNKKIITCEVNCSVQPLVLNQG